MMICMIIQYDTMYDYTMCIGGRVGNVYDYTTCVWDRAVHMTRGGIGYTNESALVCRLGRMVVGAWYGGVC